MVGSSSEFPSVVNVDNSPVEGRARSPAELRFVGAERALYTWCLIIPVASGKDAIHVGQSRMPGRSLSIGKLFCSYLAPILLGSKEGQTLLQYSLMGFNRPDLGAYPPLSFRPLWGIGDRLQKHDLSPDVCRKQAGAALSRGSFNKHGPGTREDPFLDAVIPTIVNVKLKWQALTPHYRTVVFWISVKLPWRQPYLHTRTWLALSANLMKPADESWGTGEFLEQPDPIARTINLGLCTPNGSYRT